MALTSSGSGSQATVKQVSDNRSDGVQVGQSATDLVGFFGVTPAVQPASGDQAAAVATTTTTATTTALQTDLDDVRTLVNRLRADLVTLGLIKGAA